MSTVRLHSQSQLKSCRTSYKTIFRRIKVINVLKTSSNWPVRSGTGDKSGSTITGFMEFVNQIEPDGFFKNWVEPM